MPRVQDLGQGWRLVHDWTVIRKISEPNVKNKKKFHFIQLPGFDTDKFPFIVYSGNKTINLLNIRDFNSQVESLVINASQPGQRGLFFVKESFGYSLHFTAKQKID